MNPLFLHRSDCREFRFCDYSSSVPQSLSAQSLSTASSQPFFPHSLLNTFILSVKLHIATVFAVVGLDLHILRHFWFWFATSTCEISFEILLRTPSHLSSTLRTLLDF